MAKAEEAGSDEEELTKFQEEIDKAIKAEKIKDEA